MGKQKRERRKPHKNNPTGIPSVKEIEKEAEEFDDEDQDGALNKMIEQVRQKSDKK